MIKWRPIETAPKDGSRILILLPSRPSIGIDNPEIFIAYWGPSKYAFAKEGEKEWLGDHDNRILTQPTHWMPLPDAARSE